MKVISRIVVLLIVAPSLLGFVGQVTTTAKKQNETSKKPLSYTADVAPILKKYCSPCHDEESYNKSGLSLDTYELLMKGGKNGVPIVPGKPDESILVQKVRPNPPFGDQMPVGRRKSSQTPPKQLTKEEVKIIADWITQGGVDN